MEAEMWPTVLWVVIAGFGRGLINSVRSSLRTPRYDAKRCIVDLGWIGNILTGGAATFALWGIQLYSSDVPQMYSVTFLAGFAGAAVLNE